MRGGGRLTRALVNNVIQWRDLERSVERDGFAFLAEWRRDLSSGQLLSELTDAVRFAEAPTSHCVIPRNDAPPNTYSGIYGLDDFPAHSDMAHWPEPPHYILLRCIRGYDAIATHLFDGNALIERAGSNLLARSLVRPRRPLAGRLPLMPIYRPSRKERPSLLRWDETFIVAASEAALEGMNALRRSITQQKSVAIRLTECGDTLIVDNWRTLHGRSTIPEICKDRVVERTYLRSLH